MAIRGQSDVFRVSKTYSITYSVNRTPQYTARGRVAAYVTQLPRGEARRPVGQGGRVRAAGTAGRRAQPHRAAV